jgi:hypothetical protein
MAQKATNGSQSSEGGNGVRPALKARRETNDANRE